MPPAASIVTAFYNTGGVFEQTAACVFAQTLVNWEWLIVNDGSTDPEALAVLDRYRRHPDPRVRVVDMERNSGPSAARNRGFSLARAECVYQLDSDDLIEPTTIEKFAWMFASRADVAFGASFEAGFEAQEYLWNFGFHTPEVFLKECPVGAHAVAVRRGVHRAIGGYDEAIRGGMEDWDLWLRAADHGHWGATIPEYLAWYRRRDAHAARWSDWDGGERQKRFHEGLRAKYPRVFAQAPRVPYSSDHVFEPVRSQPPFANPIAPALGDARKRLLLVFPWLTMGGADKFNRRLVEQLSARGWELTIATTLRGDNSWLPEFARFTPDIFVPQHFLRSIDVPVFLRYLIESRKPDAVLMSNSELGYWLLPYLQAHCPQPAYLDYVHMEEDYWKNGGYPRYTASARDELDLSIVSSEHLKRWVVSRGGNPAKIEVATTNEDASEWKPDAGVRAKVREELAIGIDTPVLLYAGRICLQKQPRVFAAAIRKLAAQKGEFVALVAGDGADRGILEALLSDLIDRQVVRMLGAVPNARMKELCAASDIFFLPSQWEGISLAIYEAMSSGLAIVGADVGGQKELVTPDTGDLVPRSDEATESSRYAEVLARLIGDATLRSSMGRAARERIEKHYQLSHMGDRMESLIGRAIGIARDLQARGGRPRVPASLADELATRAIEYFRVHDLADYLWVEGERLRASAGRPAPLGAPTHAPDPHVNGHWASRELAEIEGSFAWRAVSTLKGNPVYDAVARIRWGPDWRLIEVRETPEARLARIKNSRSYRFIQAIKHSAAYRKYAEMKYGVREE